MFDSSTSSLKAARARLREIDTEMRWIYREFPDLRTNAAKTTAATPLIRQQRPRRSSPPATRIVRLRQISLAKSSTTSTEPGPLAWTMLPGLRYRPH